MFARVILYTDENIEENLKSEEAAAQIGMSRSYFSTRFKEMTGDTFHNYVISRKMYAAAQKMAKGTENITQIASNLGYDNFLLFYKGIFEGIRMHANRIYRKNKKMFDLIRTFFFEFKKKL